MIMQARTVFVIGAGASKPYGLPLGEELVLQVADAVEALDYSLPGTYGALLDDDEIGQARDREEATRAAKTIRRSGAPTIDHFLQRNPGDHLRIRRAMVRVIWKREHEIAATEDRVEGDWITWLLNNQLQDDPELFALNQFIILSFNYERLPQLLLSTRLANMTGVPISRCWKNVCDSVEADGGGLYARFQHVYGAIGIDPVPNDSSGYMDCRYSERALVTASENVSTIGIDRDKTPDARRIRPLLDEPRLSSIWEWAERIVLLGVGYHLENLEKIGLGSSALQSLCTSKRFVGGTGFQLPEKARVWLREYAGARFLLGDRDQRALEYLQTHL